jgi:hypothetical protein
VILFRSISGHSFTFGSSGSVFFLFGEDLEFEGAGDGMGKIS